MSDAGQLRTLHAELLDRAERMRSNAAEFREQAAAITGKARSEPGGDIEVEVGPGGDLRALSIDPRAHRKLGPSELAEQIVELAQRAKRDAAERVAKAAADVTGREHDLDAHLAGVDQPVPPSAFPVSAEDVDSWLDRLKEGRL